MFHALLELAQIAGIASAIGLFAWLFLHDRVRATLRKVARTPIRDVREGAVVKIAGRVENLGAPLIAPLSGRPCAHYVVVVKQRHQHGKHHSTRTILREERAQDFLVRDATGTARVCAGDAFVAYEEDHHVRSGLFNDPTPELTALLARHGIDPTGLFFNKDLRCTEAVLTEGETAVVYGLANMEVDADGGGNAEGYRGPPRRPVIVAPADEPRKVLISDDAALADAGPAVEPGGDASR